MNFSMAVGTEENTLFNFLHQVVPLFVGQHPCTKFELLLTWIYMMKMQGSKILAITTLTAFTPHFLNQCELSFQSSHGLRIEGVCLLSNAVVMSLLLTGITTILPLQTVQ